MNPRCIIWILALWFAATPAFGQYAGQSERPDGANAAQDREAFEAQLERLRSTISADERRLARNRSAETASVRSLNILSRDIAIREEVVSAFEARIAQLTAERDAIYAEMQRLSQRIEALREEYRARATHAYKYGRMHDIALVLSANSINQMLVRVGYLKRFTDARGQQVEDIKIATAQLESRQRDLMATLAHTEQTLQEARKEREHLFDQKRERERLIGVLRAEGSELQRLLAERRTAERDLATRLEALIAAERRRAAANRSGFSAAEYAALTGSFESNQGRLPWPSAGTLVERFGVQVNEEYGTRTINQGIVVATIPEAEVRSVFEGRVIGIDVMPVYGRYVMVSHGDYVTVYGNLSSVLVGPEQQLLAGQLVGTAGSNTEPYGAGYFFGLSKDGFIDPANWLRR